MRVLLVILMLFGAKGASAEEPVPVEKQVVENLRPAWTVEVCTSYGVPLSCCKLADPAGGCAGTTTSGAIACVVPCGGFLGPLNPACYVCYGGLAVQSLVSNLSPYCRGLARECIDATRLPDSPWVNPLLPTPTPNNPTVCPPITVNACSGGQPNSESNIRRACETAVSGYRPPIDSGLQSACTASCITSTLANTANCAGGIVPPATAAP